MNLTFFPFYTDLFSIKVLQGRFSIFLKKINTNIHKNDGNGNPQIDKVIVYFCLTIL